MRYEPLPLGANAFMAPMAPLPEPRSVDRRRLAVYCIVGGALGIAFGGAAIAFLSSSSTERPPSVRVMDVPPTAPATAAALHEAERAHAAAAAQAKAPPAPPPQAPAPAQAPAAPAVGQPEVPAQAAQPAAPATPAAAPPRTAEPSERRRSSRRDEPTIDKPSRAQVIAAMSQVQPAVKACFSGTHGVATVDIKVQGKTGRITSAQVTGQSGPVGSCVARAARKAQFPKFTDETLSIRYPMAF